MPDKPNPVPGGAAPGPDAVKATSAATAGAPGNLWPVFCLVALQIALLALILSLAIAYAPPLRVLPLDAIVLPGAEASAGVRLDAVAQARVGRSVEGVPVRFEIVRPTSGQDGPAGEAGLLSAITDAAGVAMVRLPAANSFGAVSLRACPEPTTGQLVSPAASEVLVEVIPPESTLILVKVPDALRKDLEVEPGDAKNPPLGPREAAQELQDLGRQAAIVYVLGTRWRSAVGLRERLERRRLPRGPILGAGRSSEPDTFAETLRRLDLTRWKGPRWIVVTSREDALVGAELGLLALLVESPGGLGGDDRRIFAVETWSQAKAKILKHSRH